MSQLTISTELVRRIRNQPPSETTDYRDAKVPGFVLLLALTLIHCRFLTLFRDARAGDSLIAPSSANRASVGIVGVGAGARAGHRRPAPVGARVGQATSGSAAWTWSAVASFARVSAAASSVWCASRLIRRGSPPVAW